jgi:LacI family transcriptional regulator
VWSTERCDGFFDVICEHGFEENFLTYQEDTLDNLWSNTVSPLLAWLKSLSRPTALMACDDNQGNRIMEICKASNISVPDEIAVLGVDNDEMICNLSDPPLSSISQDIMRGGFETAQLIEQLLNDEGSGTYEDVVLQPISIVERLSTDFYSTDDAQIRTALRYIHQNLSHNISVSDIVKQVALSRRLLEIRFKEVTKQPIHKYVFNLRMERFAQLLLAGDEPISILADQIGIHDTKNLSRRFKALKGVSPAEYRKQYRIMSRGGVE